MNNPGMDRSTWERLRNKWAEQQSSGQQLAVEFRLLADPKDEKNILAIDVLQTLNNEALTETVQRKAGEAYASLGIEGQSKAALIDACRDLMQQLYNQAAQKEAELVMTMTPTSSTSGETRAYAGAENPSARRSLPVNYRHYYLLTALREKLRNAAEDNSNSIKAVYRSGELEFYFDE